MGILDKFRPKKRADVTAQPAEPYVYWVHVRCAKCGETLKGRVDLRNELSWRDDAEGFWVRKTLIGSGRCFNPVEVILYFDENRRLTEREITGGQFIEGEE